MNLAEETSFCSPPECSIALSVPEPNNTSIVPIVAISTKDLGYAPRVNRELNRLDYEAAIAFLGSNQLLFTFNPHELVPRPEPEANADLHTVRGILIDLENMKALRTMDWRVPDANQFLWPRAHGRVLLHAGRELHVYGPDLKLEQRYQLGGPLAFLRTSPADAYLAIGIVHERHTPAIHRQLFEAERREPEEDVEVRILDASLHILGSVTQSSRQAPPVLTDDGELGLVRTGKSRWRAVAHTWNGQSHALGAITSSCLPEATALPGRLALLVGCDVATGGKWYRVLRLNGKAVLKGSSSASHLEHAATWSADGGIFAIAVATATKALNPGATFRASDLDHLEISVYQPGDAERIVGLRVSTPLPTRQTFGLSPEGTRLAILRAGKIALYRLPARNSSPTK